MSGEDLSDGGFGPDEGTLTDSPHAHAGLFVVLGAFVDVSLKTWQEVCKQWWSIAADIHGWVV